MKQGPIHLILDPNDRLCCNECHRMLLNTVAFIRGRTVNDPQGKSKYRVGVVLCGECEQATHAMERSAYDDRGE